MTIQKATRWWWVRHAPVTNHKNLIYGQRDVPCDTSDKKSFQALAETLPKGAVWLTSHLSRTKDTACAIAAQGLEIPEPIIEKDLAEQNFGEWQEMSWNDFKMKTNPRHQEFWQDPSRHAPPGGESFVDVLKRVAVVIKRLNTDHAGTDIVAIAHGGTIRCAIAIALDLTPEHALSVKTDNLSLTRLDFFAAQGSHIAHGIRAGNEGGWRVAGINLPPNSL